MRFPVVLGLAALALIAGLAATASAAPSIDVLDAPDVVVANPSENMTQDNFNPDYVFSPEVRVTNDGNPSQVNTEVALYADPSTSGCPEDKTAYRVSFIVKTRELDGGESVRIGGSSSPQAGGDAYWPSAISRQYYDAKANETVEIGGHTYTMCAAVRVSGQDASCDKPEDQTCVVARDSFRSYVREENQAPEITEASVSKEEPDVGEQVLLEADATDADTQPREDDLTFTWSSKAFEATGRTARTSFPSPGEHTVRLTVSDGFDETVRRLTVDVQNPDDPGPGGTDDAPLGPAVALVGLVTAALAARRA